MDWLSGSIERATSSVALRGALDALQSPRARWRVSALAGLVAAAAAALLLSAWTPAYTATARIVLDPAAAGASGAGAEWWIATQADIIRSERVAREVAADLGLAVERSMPDRDAAASRLLSHLAVEPSQRGALIAVRYAAPDPTLAAQVADAFVTAYDRISRQMQGASRAATEHRARSLLSTLRQEVEQSRLRFETEDRALSQDRAQDLTKAMQLGRLASPIEWSGLPGEHQAGRRSGSLLADPEHAALSGASFEGQASTDSMRTARSDLAQAGQTLLTAQERLARFESDVMLAPPSLSVLSHALDSVSAPRFDAMQTVLLAAVAAWIAALALSTLAARVDRRVVGARDLSRIDGLAVLGVFGNEARRPACATRVSTRPLTVYADPVPSLP